tara:strand:+ start:37448 stop:40393 length:2946 start_codon:yes stop_codon:yes gene_type:complete
MNKPSKFKYVLKGFLIFFLLIIIVISIVPLVYKDDIIKLVKQQSDQYIDANISFDDLDLSLLSTFPSMTLEIDDLTISGKDTFQDIKLLELNNLMINLDLWKIIMDSEYEVNSIYLNEPKIHVKVLASGLANYDIYKSTDTVLVVDSNETLPSSPLEFKISNYKISNAQIIYDDAFYTTKFNLKDFNHNGSFAMIGEKYLLETNSNSSTFNLSYDGVNYFEKSKINILLNGEITFIEEDINFVITESLSKINQFNLVAKGDFLMRELDYKMNLSLSTLDQDFKSLLSVVPGIYKQDFSSINTNGEFDFKCNINGFYSDSLIPGIDMDISVNEGYFKYPDLEEPIDKINMLLKVNFPGGENLDLLKIDLQQFNLGFLNSTISSKLFVSNLTSDPSLNSSLNATFNLSDIGLVFPLEDQNISGFISSDINLNGNLSTIEEERYDEFDATGKLQIDGLSYSSSSLDYSIDLSKLDFEFHPQKLSLNELSLMVGKSDFFINGEFQNYISFALKHEKLEGFFNIRSKLIDVDQLYVETYSDSSKIVLQDSIVDTNIIAEVFSIPENIDFKLSTKVDQLIFDSLIIEKIRGELKVKDATVEFSDASMNLLGGSFNMEGNYKGISKNRASMSLKMGISNISFDKAYLYFNSVKKYASAVKYFDGDFSTNLNMSLILDEEYYPIYEKITADGNLISKNVTLLNNSLFDKLDKLDKNLIEKNKNIKDLNLNYHIKNGLFVVDKTLIKFKDFDATVYGSTSNTQDIDYTIESEIPFSFVNKSSFGITNFLSNTNIKDIPVLIKVGGTVASPNFSTNLNFDKSDVKENVISAAKEKIKDLKNEALIEAQKKADQIVKEAQKKAQKVREQADLSASKIEAEARKQNKITKAEINNQVNKIKKDAVNQANELIAKAKSPLLKIAAEKSGEKIKSKADEKATELEISLNQKADQAEKLALSKANVIRREGNEKADLIEIKAQEEANKLIEAAKNK